jgi:imidazolonepropionase-like amidohydrolase
VANLQQAEVVQAMFVIDGASESNCAAFGTVGAAATEYPTTYLVLDGARILAVGVEAVRATHAATQPSAGRLLTPGLTNPHLHQPRPTCALGPAADSAEPAVAASRAAARIVGQL